MSITLRIVGIFYYREDIPDVQEDGTPHTVETVLNYAVRNPAGTSSAFGYVTGQSATEGAGSGGSPIKSVTAFFSNYTVGSGPTSLTTGITYPEGEYFLSESLVAEPSYRVWQYYVFKAPLQSGDAVYVPRSPRIQSYTTAEVPAGGQVTWRLVDILAGPNKVPVVYRKAFGLDGSALEIS